MICNITYSDIAQSRTSVNIVCATDCYIRTIKTRCINISQSEQMPRLVFAGTTYSADTVLAGGEDIEVEFTINKSIESSTSLSIAVSGTSIYGYIGDYESGYIKGIAFASSQSYSFKIDGDFDTKWDKSNTVDGYYLPFGLPTPGEAFGGWDKEHYPINAWRISEGINDGYPYVWGFSELPPSGNYRVYYKTTSGLIPLTAYYKTASGLLPLTLTVKE